MKSTLDQDEDGTFCCDGDCEDQCDEDERLNDCVSEGEVKCEVLEGALERSEQIQIDSG